MAYSTDVATLLAEQLSRFITLNPHQLAGQVENLDFWLAEVRHALEVIDRYGVRFVRLEGGQEQYVTIHRTTMSEVGPVGPTERKPPPPRRIPDRELQKARKVLVDAARGFLERCKQTGLLSEAQVVASLSSLSIE